MVLCYYELCQKIWGGSPATERIDRGIETAEVNAAAQDAETDVEDGFRQEEDK